MPQAILLGCLLGGVAAASMPSTASAARSQPDVPSGTVTRAMQLALADSPVPDTDAIPSARKGALAPETPAAGFHVEQFKADIEQLRREQWHTPTPPEGDAGLDPVEETQALSTLTGTISLLEWLSLGRSEVARIASNSTTGIGAGLDMLQVPVGKVVIPQLPPLDAPDTYLPVSPDRFNGFIWPTRGTVTSGYGMRWGRLHQGIDIAGPVGTPIIASSSGEVVKAGWSGGYGKTVKVKHRDGSVTLYAHNSRILVRHGQQVRQGQQIAALGNTGRSTGPHLHFEIHPKGKGAANPIAFLPRKRR